MKAYYMRFYFGILVLLFSTNAALSQPITLVKNKQSNYHINLPSEADSFLNKSALSFQQLVHKMTGARIPIWSNAATDGRSIEFRINKNRSGYAGTIENGNFIIEASNSYKCWEAVFAIFENLGCRYLSPSVTFTPTLTDLVIATDYAFDPLVKTRTVHAKLFYENPEFAARRRVTTSGFPSFVPEAFVHTFHKFVPERNYYSAHPEYYALVKNKRLPTQLCLSNDTVYRMIKDSVAAYFNRYPNAAVISVSQDDNTQYCECDRCAGFDKQEGTPAASMIRLVNKIARDFPAKTISTLAYQYTRKAPKTLRPEHNVLVTLCSIECDRSAPIAVKSKDFETDLIEWGRLGATLQIWDYTTQFTNFLAPFPNLETIQPNIQLFVRNGANWIFEQHSHNTSELYELRCYLMSALLWDPYASYDKLITEFCQLYYGKGSAAVLTYVKGLEKSIKEYPKFFLFLYGDPAQGFDTWLSGQKLLQYQQAFDQSEKALKGQPQLLERLNKARIGLDYATLEYFRTNRAPFELNNRTVLNAVYNRFKAATLKGNIPIVNEMGLTLDTYLKSYQQFMTNAGKKNLARGAAVSLVNKPVKYAKEDPQTLTDGAFGGWSFFANWLGFLNEMKATVDLKETKQFRSIGINFLQVTNHVVFFPLRVKFEISEDGINYTTISTVENPFPLQKTSKVNDIYQFHTPEIPMKARYIRVTGENMNTPPYWHHAAGTGAWIFADEIVVSE